MSVKIEIQSFSQGLQSFFENTNKTPLLNAVGNAIHESIIEQFDSEGSHFLGQKWKPLAPRTIKEREEQGYIPINILQRTGILKGSIAFDVSGDEILFKVGAEYGFDLQYGTNIIPPRPFMPVSDNLIPESLKQEILGLCEDFFEQQSK